MFRDLLGWAFKQADVTPNFTAPHCLAVHGTGCTACADACPHEAVAITRTVTIDPIDCTGCGLCVAACPSFALTPRERAPIERALRCSQVSGEGSSTVCLARLQATDLVRMAAGGASVTLARSDCAGCDIGGPGVPAAVEDAIEAAQALLAMHGRELDIDVVEVERFEVPPDRRELSRRDLLRGGWTQVRRSGSTMLAPLERFAEPDDEPEGRLPLPAEHRRRLRAIELAAPTPETLVPLRLPEVLDGCILCPSCTRACPTNAIRRVFDGDAAGGARLDLDGDACIGCDACVDACPVDVVRMRDEVSWGEVTGPTRVVYRAERPTGPLGAVARGGPGSMVTPASAPPGASGSTPTPPPPAADETPDGTVDAAPNRDRDGDGPVDPS